MKYRRRLTINITAEVESSEDPDDNIYPSVSTMLYMLADENSRQEGPMDLTVEQGPFKATMVAKDEVIG